VHGRIRNFNTTTWQNRSFFAALGQSCFCRERLKTKEVKLVLSLWVLVLSLGFFDDKGGVVGCCCSGGSVAVRATE